MMNIVRRQDLDFLLYNVLNLERLGETSRFHGQDRALFDAVLSTAIHVAADKFEPCAAELDAKEPEFVDGRVKLPPATKVAVDAFIEAGFMAAAFSEDVGGSNLPYSILQAAMATFYAANVSAVAYPLLTIAASNLLVTHGSLAQRQTFLLPMIQGRFFGTMCLSETQAGSSLADITTSATPRPDDSYEIVGNKMWISGGDHDLSENIVHLVLARVPGSPAGVKGISLFIVPKFRQAADGSWTVPNDVQLAGLNHKMGYHGTVNTVLNFGENRQCHGYLVGEANRGLAYMFHMMNEARIGVGLGASMLGYAGYRHSLEYARQRLQGRPAHQKDPNAAQIPIIEHADVRRMLLAQKAYVEGAMALGFYCAMLVDEIAAGIATPASQAVLDLLTPIAKAWPSDYALEANSLAIQVLGGYGYTRDYPVERLYRDNRLNAIHEGTNGIQALDLLGRKVVAGRGASLRAVIEMISADVAKAPEALKEYRSALSAACELWAETTMTLAGRGLDDVELYLANATEYLHLAGHCVIAWMWIKQMSAAQKALDAGDADEAFMRGKIHAGQYFFRRELPKCRRWAELLVAFDDTTLRMQDPWF